MFKNTTDSSSAFQIQSSTGDNYVSIDTSGGSVCICDSASCDTISIGTNSDADAINIGDSNDTTTIAGNITLSDFTNCASLGTNSSGNLVCGDGPDTSTFTDSTPANFANNTTTELFNDGTKPNITPLTTSSKVMVFAFSRARGGSTTDSLAEYRIVREDDRGSSTPSCDGTVPQVGDAITSSMTSNNAATDHALGSATFIDSPGSSNAVYYTVCSNSLTATQTLQSLTVTLMVVGADYAENYYTTDDSIVPGDIVSIDSSLPAGAQKSHGAYDKNVIGIVSTAPYKIADDKIGASQGRAIPVALSGRVPVKVTTENGPIKVGDLLTTSATVPGAAMKATRAGQIVGQAMTTYSGIGVGQVFAFVKTDFSNGPSINDLMSGLSITSADGSTTSTNLSTDLLSGLVNLANQQPDYLSASDITTDRLAAAVEIVTPKLTADKIAVNSLESATGANISLKLGANGQFTVTNGAGDNVITFDEFGNAQFTGTITADKIKANQIEGLEVLTDKINSLTTAVLGADTSSDTTDGTTPTTPTQSLIDLVNANFQTVTVTLNLNVMGDLLANGGLIVKGDANFLGNVNFGGHISTDGNAPTVDADVAAGLSVAPADNPDAVLATTTVDGNDLSGQLTVTVGDSSTTGSLVSVTFKKPYSKTPRVLLTPANEAASKVGYYVQATATGFKIIINTPQPTGTSIHFNYWVTQ